MNGKAELLEKFDRVGGIEPAVGQAFDPLSLDEIKSLATDFGGPLPDSLKLYLCGFGAIGFRKMVFYQPAKPFPTSYSRTNTGIARLLFGKTNPERKRGHH